MVVFVQVYNYGNLTCKTESVRVGCKRNVNSGDMHCKMTGLVVRYHLQLYDINFGFLFAFRTEEGKVNKNGVFVDFDSCFSAANGAVNPKWFICCVIHQDPSKLNSSK